jgi:hypothetical protein
LNEFGYSGGEIDALFSDGVLYDKYRAQPAMQA